MLDEIKAIPSRFNERFGADLRKRSTARSSRAFWPATVSTCMPIKTAGNPTPAISARRTGTAHVAPGRSERTWAPDASSSSVAVLRGSPVDLPDSAAMVANEEPRQPRAQ